jgi:hypothetical protein
LDSLDALSFANRFLMVWHYNAVGKYLRNLFEHWAEFSYSYLWNTKKDIWKKKMLETIHSSSNLTEDDYLWNWWNTKKHASKQTYILYQYLCWYVHHISKIDTVSFNEMLFRKNIHLITITLGFVAKIIIMWVGEKVPNYWHNLLLERPGDDKPYYAHYISALLNDNWFSRNIWRKTLDRHWLNDLQIDAYSLFERHYFYS